MVGLTAARVFPVVEDLSTFEALFGGFFGGIRFRGGSRGTIVEVSATAIVGIETQSDDAISGGPSLIDGDRGVDTAAIFYVGVSRENTITFKSDCLSPTTGGISFTGEQVTPSPNDTKASPVEYPSS